MKVRRIIDILSRGVIIGFIVSFIIFLNSITANRYVQYKMFRLVALSLQNYLNKWMILIFCAFVILLLFSFLIKLLYRLFLENKILIHIKDENKLEVLFGCIVCTVFFFYGGWAINHYWLPNMFHPISLLADVGILIFAIFIGWVLIRVRWVNLFRYIRAEYIRRTALTLIISLTALNFGIVIDAKVNIPKGPNIVLISIDTLRADHLGCYGYKINTTRSIDRFSKESVLFTNARSQIHWTTPSHLSLFTSLYPSIFKVWEYPDPGRLHNRYLTLAEILRNYGYATAAFTAGGFVHKIYGFKQGFDIYKDEIRPNNIRTIFNKFGLDWIKKQKTKFMVFLHCYEPHVPYNPPIAFKEEFASIYTPVSLLTEAHYYFGADSDIGRKAVKSFRELKDMNFLKTVIGLYDGEIRYVDSEIEKLFDKLKKIDVFDNCLVIFLSDHGEAFNEHNSFSHSTLYDEILRVPLIIHLPKTLRQYNRKSINDAVSLVDVLPTILDICQIPYSPNDFQGTSLLNLIKNKGLFPRKYSFSERLRCKAIASLEYKYKICTVKPRDELEEFYDISQDRRENYNLLQAKSITTRVKKAYLQNKKNLIDQLDKNKTYIQNILGRDIPVRKIRMDEETKKRLRTLGYVK